MLSLDRMGGREQLAEGLAPEDQRPARGIDAVGRVRLAAGKLLDAVNCAVSGRYLAQPALQRGAVQIGKRAVAHASPSCCTTRSSASPRGRIRLSCCAVAIIRPSSAKKCPRLRPRAPPAHGLSATNRCQRSKSGVS